MVYLNYFRKVHEHFKFKYDHSYPIWVDVENNVFELDPVDGNSLNVFVEKST